MTDPLEVFSEITCEKIFEYVRPEDLLSCSLLNKRYYEFIANSSRCMSRLKINLNCANVPQIESLKLLTNSTRKYHHLEASNISIDWFNTYINRFNFKSIKIKRVSVYDESELEIFFTKISGTIEELKIERFIDSKIKEFDLRIPLGFPKLKHLELHYIPNFIYKIILTCKNLRILKITGKCETEFYSLLRNNLHLKSLSIVSSEIDNYFEEDLTDLVKFKLTFFEARDIYDLSVRFLENFKKFIEQQADRLEEINLGDWISADIVQLIFHMPKVKSLTFKGFHNVEDHVNFEEMDFHKSTSITTLNLIDTFSRLDIIKAFVYACPNVVRMKLYSLKENSLIFLTQALPNLESLTVDLMEVENLKNECDFQNMKEFSMKICHKNLKFSNAVDNNFENLVRKEVVNIETRNKVKFL